jgi:drug/metabolite transporter (DMT)-like permease
LNPLSATEFPDITRTSADSWSRPKPLQLALALIAVLLIWSFNYVAGKIAMRHIDAMSLALMRMPLAALLMLPVYGRQGRRTPLARGDIWTFTYLGFFGVVINMGCYTLGLGHTTSQHAVVVMALGPVLVLLLAATLKIESLSAAKALGMVISFLGVVALETERRAPGHSPLLLGDLITLSSITGFSIYTVLAKRVAMRYDPVSMNTYNLVSGAILVLPFSIWQMAHLRWGRVGWVGWLGMFYMAAFSAVLSYTIFAWILRYMDPSRIAAINYVQTVVVILISIPLLGEHPTSHLLAGAALVLLGVYLAERGS